MSPVEFRRALWRGEGLGEEPRHTIRESLVLHKYSQLNIDWQENRCLEEMRTFNSQLLGKQQKQLPQRETADSEKNSCRKGRRLIVRKTGAAKGDG